MQRVAQAAMVGLLNAPRGTKLYARLVSENRLLKTSSGDNTDLSMNFIPKIGHEKLISGDALKASISNIRSNQKKGQHAMKQALRPYHPPQ